MKSDINNGKVSVIITTFKGENFIKRAIKSVINQTYNNIEIIIVDDNGINTPNQIKTQNIVKSFKDERIEYITHEVNKNGAVARNTGIKNCTGKYICFLDDDDIMLPKRIELCVNKLDENKEFDAVYTDVICTDENLIPTKIVEVREEGNCFKQVMLNDMFFGTGSNIFITKKAQEQTGFFDEAFIRLQDLEYMIRFYRNFKSTYVGEIAIIKAKNGINNIPRYEKMKSVNEKYVNKFEREINMFTQEEKNKFFKCMDNKLELSKLIYDKITLTNFKLILKMNVKKKIHIMFFKCHLDKTHLFNYINSVRRKIGARKIYPILNKELKEFINENK